MGPNEQLRLYEVDQRKSTYAIRRILYGCRSEDQIANQSNPLLVHMTSTLRQNDKLHPSSSPSTIIAFCLECGSAHNLLDLLETAPYATEVPGKSILLCLKSSRLPRKGFPFIVHQIVFIRKVFTLRTNTALHRGISKASAN
jgi:hypothetical protein